MADFVSNVAAVSALKEMDDDMEKQRNNTCHIAFLAASIIQIIEREEKSRIRGYVEEVVPNYAEDDFGAMFHMKPSTFQSLLDCIKDVPKLQPAGAGRRDPICIEKQLLITLWYVGGNDSIRRIADRFGVSQSTVIACRDKIMSVLLTLKNRLITWPNQQEIPPVQQKFERRNGFPGILGAIDGTHIAIRAPKENPQRYVNRKQFHSIQLQCVCLHNMQFSHVSVG
ncbi:putative nuclease HARBI1 [Dreissena polymorpha]|uniref:putative nuclease HARBI1 n=1 Tax=Dreissena polymorpha TaxID=45954 RepID=UPI0022656075|nr:putative nuclease HARBI1 [Dreissena polymorpha]